MNKNIKRTNSTIRLKTSMELPLEEIALSIACAGSNIQGEFLSKLFEIIKTDCESNYYYGMQLT